MPRSQLHPVPHASPHELELWWLELDPGTTIRARRESCQEALLELLSDRLGRTVRHSEIVVGPTGKPRLASSEIDFNLSHSGSEALIGIGSAGEIGVDLEVVRAVPEAAALVAEYCTGNERDEWLCTDTSERDLWLLRCWTRKEACLKAIGAGHFHPPAAIEVGVGPGPARVTLWRGADAHDVEVCSAASPTGSPAAVAIRVRGHG